jgi:hypothetical protein
VRGFEETRRGYRFAVREKLRVAGFVLLLVAVWGVGFLWMGGSLPWTEGEAAARKVAPVRTEAPRATASPASPTPSPKKSAVDRAAEKVTATDETRPVDLNPSAARPAPRVLPPVARFTMATFNVLGNSHTGPGGHHSWLASGPQRVGGVLQLFAQHGVSVAGLQEFQPSQRRAFRARAAGWQLFPGPELDGRAGENSVAWRTDTWELVKPGLVSIPYFNGRTRPMPYVLLQHRATGVRAYFSTFHNPADTRQFRGQQRFRNAATERQIDLFNRLEGEGIPQFVTGDMNERAEYFCKVTGRTTLVAAAGGSNSGGCRPPRPAQIDWIFGSRGAVFGNYRVDRGPLVRRTSDHPLVTAEVTVDALEFDNAYSPGGVGPS